MRTLLIVNPGSGRGLSDDVREALEARLGAELTVHEIAPDAESPETLAKEIARAVEAGAALVVVCGGDGTVAGVADAMIRAGVADRVPMAIVAGGTANVMARELGIPVEPEPAIALPFGDFVERPVDAMRVDGRHFISQIGIGLDALMIQDTPTQAKKRFGRAAYLVTLLGKLGQHRAHRFQIDVDGKTFRIRAGQVLLANVGAFGLKQFSWGPDIDVSDGVINLCLFDIESMHGYLRLLGKAITGHHVADGMSRYERVRHSVKVSSWVPISVQADGEIIGTTPLTVTVVASAVKIVVPRAEPEPAGPVAAA